MLRNPKTALAAAVAAAAAACTTLDRGEPSQVRVLPASEVEWQLLNPLRGDASPGAGTLWGDRGAPVPCGFLAKFVDGFSSPPHIHPVTYRAVVIRGLVHNDDPDAEDEWLPSGSYWTQPGGEAHITAAQGSENVAYVEIERGPYLVKPAAESFDPTEAPVKLRPEAMEWRSLAEGAEVAPLTGNPGDDALTRSMVRLADGFTGVLRAEGGALHAVVVTGRWVHSVDDLSESATLEPGSYFGSDGRVAHRITCTGEPCLLYVRTDGAFEVDAE